MVSAARPRAARGGVDVRGDPVAAERRPGHLRDDHAASHTAIRSATAASSSKSVLTQRIAVPLGSQAAHDLVDLGARRDVDALGRLVQQQHPRTSSSQRGEQDLLLVAAAERGDSRGRVRRAGCRRSRRAPRRPAPDLPGAQHAAAEVAPRTSDSMFFSTERPGASPWRLRSAGTSAIRACWARRGVSLATSPDQSAQRSLPRPRGEAAEERVGKLLASRAEQAGYADDLAGVHRQRARRAASRRTVPRRPATRRSGAPPEAVTAAPAARGSAFARGVPRRARPAPRRSSATRTSPT